MGDTNAFEAAQRDLTIPEVDAQVNEVLRHVPPDDKQLEGIKRNIANLKANGNWATARFYETLLEKREASQEG